MFFVAGSHVRIELALSNAHHVGPSWLAAAVTGTYPGLDLAEVESYDGFRARLVCRARKPTEINIGDTVAAAAEGIQLPAGALPSGTVTAAEEVELLMHPADVAAQAVAQLPTEYNVALKLTLAGALLAAVAYFTNRIRRAEEAL